MPSTKSSKTAADSKEETAAGLSERALAVAKTELREDRLTREQALQHFREWIVKNQDLENCRTGKRLFQRSVTFRGTWV